MLSTVLKQIAYMQGNTYHLHQHMWNDVNEEWPFYTEQEKQLLKRLVKINKTPTSQKIIIIISQFKIFNQ